MLMIEIGDFGEVFSEDTVHALNLLDETPAPQCCLLSANAQVGTKGGNTLRLRALVGDQIMLLLVDSGSSHTFVNAEFAKRAGCVLSPSAPVSVKIANGQYMHCNQMVQNLNWKYQDIQFTDDMGVLELGAYDAVLGMDWLDKFSPMTCEWHEKWLEIPKDSKLVMLQGIIPAAKVQLLEVDHKQLDKWINSNEVWALAVLESIPSALAADSSVAPDLQCILSDFADVFQDPKSLPPHRALDHAITLIKEDQPINSRPYRYSPLHKDEIERQVSEMLKSGVITTFMSPYASHVLLVKKKDDSWRFCVDFRRLNNITVKNKFPLPIVDELLDELAGTKFFSKIDLRAGYHQIRMREADKHKTAFKTHHGHISSFGSCHLD